MNERGNAIPIAIGKLVEHPDICREGRSFEMMFYTYILRSDKNDQYYVGHSGDLTSRVQAHNAGEVRSTKYKRPWRLVYYETFRTKLEANQRELEIKKKKSRKYINFLIDNKRE